MTTTPFTNELSLKRNKIQQAAIQLKKEFFGIDSVIDKLIETASSWYLFPELQDKPVVVCLWGLTGTGKTSLVNRFAELIDFNNKHFRFDLGEQGGNEFEMKEKLHDLYEKLDHEPLIISFDEIQHVRTKSEDGSEIEKPQTRIVWELMDSGIISINQFSYAVNRIVNLLMALNTILEHPVEVKNGIVVEGKDIYEELIDARSDYYSSGRYRTSKKNNTHQDTRFIPDNSLNDLFEIARTRFKKLNELNDVLMTLNGEQTLQFLSELLMDSYKPKQFDARKSLIMVLGNLDEVYHMSNDVNPDIDADLFYRQSLRTTVTEVKKSLQKRFRNEQIARFGNHHIIYPSLNKAAYRNIIERQLELLSKKVEDLFKVKMTFDDTLIHTLYREGVYPAQGTRPLFSSIQLLVSGNLGKVVEQYVEEKCKGKNIQWHTKKNRILVDVMNGKVKELELSLPISGDLNKLRVNRKDDRQALVAVHEAGHAVISTVLFYKVPHQVLSVTADFGSEGFNSFKTDDTILCKSNLLKYMAVLLGGYAAEKVIFGESNISMGSQSDFNKATDMVTDAVRLCGLSGIVGAYQQQDQLTNDKLHDDGSMNKICISWMEEALSLAEETIDKHKIFFLKIARYLSDHAELKRTMLMNLIKENEPSIHEAIVKGTKPYANYRKVLLNLTGDVAGRAKQE